MRYITLPDGDNTLSCIVSTGHFCRLDNAIHWADRAQNCSSFLFENNNEHIFVNNKKE